MNSVSSPRFSVYLLLRPDDRVFYVGKATIPRRRLLAHKAEARRGHKCHRCSVIRGIWSEGSEVTQVVVFESDNEKEALAYEQSLIALIGRENLTNLTDGGEGMSGYVVPPDVRAKIAAASVARAALPEERESRRERMIRVWRDPEARAVRLARQRAALKRPEIRAKIKRGVKAVATSPKGRAQRQAQVSTYVNSPEGKAQRRATTSARYNDPSERINQSERMKATWTDPQMRRRQRASLVALYSTPEAKIKRSAVSKAVWANPESREKHVESLRQTLATPEAKARKSAATKAGWANPETRAKRSASIRASLARRNADKPKICTIDGCKASVRAKGLCARHYSSAEWARRKAAKDKG